MHNGCGLRTVGAVTLTVALLVGQSLAASDKEAAPKVQDDTADAGNNDGEGTCNPALPIFHMVMKFNERDFIRTGAPKPPSVPIREGTTLRSCQRWQKGSCCTDKFFQQVG